MAWDTANDSYVEEVRRRVSPLLTGAGINPATLHCTLAWDGSRLTVRFSGSNLAAATRQAIGVHVLGALSTLGRTVGEVKILYG